MIWPKMSGSFASTHTHAIATLASLVALGITYVAHTDQLDRLKREKNKLTTLYQQQASALNHRLSPAESTRYQHARERGIFAAANREAWLDALRQFAQNRPTLAFQLEIPPNTDSDKSAATTGRLHMRLGQLPENDFLALLSDLDKHAPALVSLERCELARSSRGSNIDAECEFSWLNFPEQP